MLPTTFDVFKSAMKADPTVSPSDLARVMKLVRSRPDATPTDPAEVRMVRRKEAAHILSRSLRSVDQLAAAGMLTKKRLPGRQRAAGFLLEDVLNLVRG